MKSSIERRTSKVYLTGFMGSGKSTVGPHVAQALGARFCDLDDVIVTRAGRSIPSIFASEGEAGFRRREADALQAVSAEAEATIIATGGGTLTREANLQYALRHGRVVYLRVPAPVLAARLRPAAAGRPLLQDDDGQPLSSKALTERIAALLDERTAFYERASVVVNAVHDTPQETARTLVEQLNETWE